MLRREGFIVILLLGELDLLAKISKKKICPKLNIVRIHVKFMYFEVIVIVVSKI